MTDNDLIGMMAADAGSPADDARALQNFTAALHRVDTDPQEQRRICDLADTVDAEIAAYDQGLAALDSGDVETAIDRLLKAGTTGEGDADTILGELLAHRPEESDSVPLAIGQRAAEIRAHRAILNAAYNRRTKPTGTGPRWRALLQHLPAAPFRKEDGVSADDLADVLLTAMEVKDPYTRRHLERISRLVTVLGQQIGMCAPQLEATRLAGLLHDVGKLVVPNTVLHKATALTENEFMIIQLHTARGAAIVQDLPEFFDTAPASERKIVLSETVAGILHHHEKFNGCGYPMGLAGHDIPEVARVIAVADAFDAMTTARSYRRARSLNEAMHDLRRGAGTHFDPDMVDAFLSALTSHSEMIEEIIHSNRPPAFEAHTEPTTNETTNRGVSNINTTT